MHAGLSGPCVFLHDLKCVFMWHAVGIFLVLPELSDSGFVVVVFVGLLFYVHGKHLRSCRDGQLT